MHYKFTVDGINALLCFYKNKLNNITIVYPSVVVQSYFQPMQPWTSASLIQGLCQATTWLCFMCFYHHTITML